MPPPVFASRRLARLASRRGFFAIGAGLAGSKVTNPHATAGFREPKARSPGVSEGILCHWSQPRRLQSDESLCHRRFSRAEGSLAWRLGGDSLPLEPASPAPK